MRKWMIGTALTGLTLLSLQAQAQQAVQAGVTAAVRGDVRLTSKATAKNQSKVGTGDSVYLGDAMSTGVQSGSQLMLMDETTFTVGADSEVNIDEFVYDPNTSVGKMAASVSKGAFRFVSGQIAKNDPGAVKINTPVGVIGIRGTLVIGQYQPNAQGPGQQLLLALAGPGRDTTSQNTIGKIDVSNAGVSRTIGRSGYATILRPGQPPSPPFALPPEALQAIGAQLGAEANDGQQVNESGAGEGSGMNNAFRTAEQSIFAAVNDSGRAERAVDIADSANNAIQIAQTGGANAIPSMAEFRAFINPPTAFNASQNLGNTSASFGSATLSISRTAFGPSSAFNQQHVQYLASSSSAIGGLSNPHFSFIFLLESTGEASALFSPDVSLCPGCTGSAVVSQDLQTINATATIGTATHDFTFSAK